MLEHFGYKDLPIILRTERRSVLVVGGGGRALRKIPAYLEAGIYVTVVAPEVCDTIETWSLEGRISIIKREVEEGDISDQLFVLIALKNRDTSSQIADWCHKKRVLCSCAQEHWRIGDFFSPALHRTSDITVSVSTNGVMCRRSKKVKNLIARHIEAVNSADLFCVGVSIGEDECSDEINTLIADVEAIEEQIMQLWGAHEFVLLKTCRRLECIALISDQIAVKKVLLKILGFDRVAKERVYSFSGFDAFSKLIKLSAGLYSDLQGEYHIVAQVKEAFHRAIEKGYASEALADLLGGALHISKKIRQLFPQKRSLSLEQSVIKSIEIEPKNVVVVGSGTVARSIIKELKKELPTTNIVVGYRSQTIENLPVNMQIQLNSKELTRYIEEAELIISAISPVKPIFTDEKLPKSLPKNQIWIDCSSPPSVDSETIRERGLKLIGLKEIHKAGSISLPKDLIDEAERIISDNRSLYEKNILSPPYKQECNND